MTDVFTNKIRLEERAANQRHWSGKIKRAITEGMSHKGDTISKFAEIMKNINTVTDEMEEEARKYDRETGKLKA